MMQTPRGHEGNAMPAGPVVAGATGRPAPAGPARELAGFGRPARTGGRRGAGSSPVWRARARRGAGVALILMAALVLVACGRGEDRPGTVSVDPESKTTSVSGTGTATASGTGSGSGTGTHSGSASGTHSGSATGTHTGAEPGHVEPKPAGAAQVNVTLKEWAIEVEPATVKAGQVYFLVTNAGPDHPHELVIVRTDKDPEELPVVEGRVPEDQVEMIGEVEAFAPGTQASGVFRLEPGKYVLICNLVEREAHGELESHVEEGMVATLTVEP